MKWTCIESDSDPRIEFQVKYTLLNKDQCNAEDDLLNVEQYTDWGRWGRVRESSSNHTQYSYYVSGLFLHSTYAFGIYSRELYDYYNSQRLYDNKITTESAGEK